MRKKRKKKIKKIPSYFTRKMSEKASVLFVIFLLILFFLSVVILKINETSGDEYTVQVLAQQNYSNKIIPFKRGDIVDRNGVTLATSIKVYNLILDPKLILTEEEFLEPTLTALNECFGYDKTELTNLIQEKSDRSYVVYQKKLSYEEIEKFLEISNDTKNNPNVKGVTFENEYERKYPFSTLASHVIGFTAAGNVGIGGIEQSYDKYLDGVDGREYGYVNQDNIMEDIRKEATNGDTVVSTIDFHIQTIVEKYVAQWAEKYQAENIGAIIMDPNNGEILAMAGNQNYDLNNPRDLTPFYTQEEIDAMDTDKILEAMNIVWRNYCISDSFEPGSTFKPFTIAAALEEGIIEQTDTYLCDGKEYFHNVANPISCHKRSGHGVISLSQAIAYSCNDALMAIAAKEGGELLVNYQKRFGFGSVTGIDLPGESSCEGLLYNPESMVPTDLAVCSFGQGFNVTMIQLISGFCSLINGGYYYEPHVVNQIVKDNGSIVENIEPTVIKQTITKETSDFLKVGLRECVVSGTGKSAAVSGYQVSGKTGTAQKLPRSEGEYILTFIGFAPYNNPKAVCYVLVDNPQGDDSSAVTGSLYKAIMSEVLPYLNAEMDGPIIEEVTTPEGETPTQAEGETSGETQTPTQTEEQTSVEGETPVANEGYDEVAGDNIPAEE